MLYQRPQIEPTEAQKLALTANKIVRSHPRRQLEIVLMLLIENASMLQEINQHRHAQGYEPLPGYKVDSDGVR